MTGLVHLYCGNGKGKTTAAMGAALRAAGRGRRVLIARFLKTDDSGEVAALKQVRGVTLLPCTKSFGFSWNMTEAQKKEAAVYYSSLLEMAWKTASQPQSIDMLVLDEIVAACTQGFVSEERLITLLKNKPEELEVILTGRSPSAELAACADYVTEMVMCRHPYEKGIKAREGIEY
ncbi:MAG: cob(I)yrinic acid a,c-diamide adenosyltransferase [Enterocloster sp.]